MIPNISHSNNSSELGIQGKLAVLLASIIIKSSYKDYVGYCFNQQNIGILDKFMVVAMLQNMNDYLICHDMKDLAQAFATI